MIRNGAMHRHLSEGVVGGRVEGEGKGGGRGGKEFFQGT